MSATQTHHILPEKVFEDKGKIINDWLRAYNEVNGAFAVTPAGHPRATGA
jgi:hypothetical protein